MPLKPEPLALTPEENRALIEAVFGDAVRVAALTVLESPPNMLPPALRATPDDRDP